MGNSHKNLVWNQLLNWNQSLIKQSLYGPLPKLCLEIPPSDQDGCTAELNLTQDPMGNSHTNLHVWNQQLNQNQTLMAQSLDGPLPKLCSAVTLSHQDGHHSSVALLLKAALIQVSDYRLLGASGCQHQPSIKESLIGTACTGISYVLRYILHRQVLLQCCYIYM